MLTASLVRARVKGRSIEPAFLPPGWPRHRERARALVEIHGRAVEERWTRGRIAEAVEDLVGDGVDHRIVRGMAKLLDDVSEYEAPGEPAPGALRERLFEAVGARPGREEALSAYRALAAEIGTTPEALRERLYADRKQEQRIASCRARDADWLLHRYDVALVQALLLRALEVEVSLDGPSPERVRQLLRHVKFRGLMYRVRSEGRRLVLRLDGPASLLRLSTRYGLALASWFPALLLQECSWELVGTVLWTKRRLRKELRLSSELGLRSHYADTGAWVSRVEKWFQERFEALDSGWSLSREGVPIDLGGQAVVVPDFTFRRGDLVAHLEILGVWRRAWLALHLGLLARHGPGNLVLAVSRRLQGAEEGGVPPGPVVAFEQVVPAREVLAMIERCARPSSG